MTSNSQDSPRPGFGGNHHLPPYSILCASPRHVHPNGFLSWDSQGEVSKLPRFGLPQLCGTITPCSNLRSGWGLKQSCSLHWDFFQWCVAFHLHARGGVDSRLFVVGSKIANVTPGLSFCHKLCCRCPNGSCNPILDIYTLIAFQWYKDFFNVRCFDLCNRSLKVWESQWTPKFPFWECESSPWHFSRLGLRH